MMSPGGSDIDWRAQMKSTPAQAQVVAMESIEEKSPAVQIQDPATNTLDDEIDRKQSRIPLSSKTRTTILRLAILALFTGWWIASLILHRHDKPWIVPFLLWLGISLCVGVPLLPCDAIRKLVRWTGYHALRRFTGLVPQQLRIVLSAVIVTIAILTVTFEARESGQNTRVNRAVSLIGLCCIIFGLWATSYDRRRVQWRRVIVGFLLQFLIALFVLRTSAGYDVFNFISTQARNLLGFAGEGVTFLTDDNVTKSGWFLITVVPPIIFFVALVQLLYYYGFLQYCLGRFAVVFSWGMNASGAEAIAAAACPFVGQGENAALIGPFVSYCTKAEIHQIMCSAFSTIAGGVLGAYIGLGVNPRILVSSCAMSIPASLALSHLRYPETEEPLKGWKVTTTRSNEQQAVNGLHAFSQGAWLGLKVAGMVVAILLCIIALLALVDGLLTWFGSYLNLRGEYELTVELVMGYICYPIAFLLGIPRNQELLLVGRLIGVKIIANEFIAYSALVSEPQYIAMSQRSQYVVSYALCGFGNIAAVGSQIAVLSQIAPDRSSDISKLAMSALWTGILSTLSSACMAGMLMIEQ